MRQRLAVDFVRHLLPIVISVTALVVAVLGTTQLGNAASITAFQPVADSYVDSSAAASNYGTNTALRVDGSPTVRTYLRFNPSGLTGTVTRATLRVWADTAQGVGYDVFGVADTTWVESGITFNNKPGLAATKTGSSGPVAAGTWTTVDVTPLVSGNGLISIALTTPSTTALRMQSRHNTRPPELVVTTTTADTVAPTVASLSPADDATGVMVASSLVVTFDEAVQLGTGAIVIKQSDGLVESFDVATSARVTLGAGNTQVTIDPTSDLGSGSGYHVEIAATAITDTSGNPFAGISDASSWNFTTADTAAPTVVALSPADDATGVGAASNLVVTFSEAVAKGTGAIVIRESVGDGLVESFEVATSARVTLGAGNTQVTIDPTADLAAAAATTSRSPRPLSPTRAVTPSPASATPAAGTSPPLTRRRRRWRR